MDASTQVDEVALTPEGFERLQAEHETLLHSKLPQASSRLREAAVLDSTAAEAGEYLAARSELELLQERLALVEQRLRSARVLPSAPGAEQVVALGARVTVEDLADGHEEEYVLVSSAEADPIEGRISNESPVGHALEGEQAGDVVDVRTPGGTRHLRIRSVV
jgi:transcription elongation factor GreA